jgi:hypothetical protein
LEKASIEQPGELATSINLIASDEELGISRTVPTSSPYTIMATPPSSGTC